MTGAAGIRVSIRKALETALFNVMNAQTPKILCEFSNLEVDPTKVAEYVSLSVHYASTIAMVIGATPRPVVSGFALVISRTQSASGPDRVERMGAIADTAFPYNAALARDGISVIIGVNDILDATPDGPWWMAPLRVNWKVWM